MSKKYVVTAHDTQKIMLPLQGYVVVHMVSDNDLEIELEIKQYQKRKLKCKDSRRLN